MTLPTFVAAGAGSTTAPAWPAGYAVGDLGLLIVANRGDVALSTPSGWNHGLKEIGVAGATTVNVVLDIYWRFATSLSETAPAISGGSTPFGVVVVYRGVNGANPFQVTSTLYMKANAGASPGLTTQLNDCLVLDIYGSQTKQAGPLVTAVSNDGSTLASQTTRFDAGITSGVGMYLVVIDGQKSSMGAVGITRITTSPAISSCAILKLALQAATQSLGHKSRAVNTEM